MAFTLELDRVTKAYDDFIAVDNQRGADQADRRNLQNIGDDRAAGHVDAG